MARSMPSIDILSQATGAVVISVGLSSGLDGAVFGIDLKPGIALGDVMTRVVSPWSLLFTLAYPD